MHFLQHPCLFASELGSVRYLFFSDLKYPSSSKLHNEYQPCVSVCVCLAPCRVPYCFMIYAELSLSFSISSLAPRSMWASAEIHSRADKWLNTCPLSLSTMHSVFVPGEHEREERISVGRFCRRSSSVIGQRCLSLPP